MNDNNYASSNATDLEDIYRNNEFSEFSDRARSEGYLTDNANKKKRKPILHRPEYNSSSKNEFFQ